MYELSITGTGESCGSVTPITPVVVATLNITSPVADHDVVSGVHDFTAEYVDNDPTVDNIQWAIRAGTCAAGTGTVAGNVDSYSNPSSFVGSAFSATVDTSSFAPGEYCFVVNPKEQNGEPDLRATRKFVIEEPPTSEVTICKYDNANEPKALSGWQLTLLGSKVGEVSAPGNGTVVSIDDVPAGEYVAKASGTYKYRTDAVSIADARFSQRRIGEPMTAPYEPWRIANLGGLHINGFTGGVTNADWGTVFSPSHVYYAPLSLSSTDDIDFKVGDDQYNDNSGSLLAELYTGYTGVTEENGCVTFEDVPYGTYQIEELLQDGWENVSGLGSVDVDAETETFTVTNRDLSVPLTCEVSIQSSTETVIDSYGYAVETYNGHSLWTGVIPNATWIWSDYYVTDPEVAETHTFTETFNVTNPSAATLVINADNWYKIIVNGDEVVTRNENSYQAFQQKTYTDEIKDALISGENTIEFVVTNDAMDGGSKLTNPAGLLFSLTVTGEGEDEDCVVTTEPEEDPNTPPVEVCGEGYTGTYPDCVEIDNSTTTPDSGDTQKKKSSGGTKIKTLSGPTPFVLGASTSQCGMYLFDYLKKGQDNDKTEVTKLQAFLIGQGYLGIQMNGIFDDATDQAVKDFQLKYAAEILDPWVSAGILTVSPPTGWVYQLTRWKINNIVCPGSEVTPTLIP